MIDTAGKTLNQVCEEIFQLLNKQGKRCVNESGCVYGNDEGHHCAVGFLLPEDDKKLMNFSGSLNQLINHSGIGDLGINGKFIEKYFTELTLLQSVHDCVTKEYRISARDELADRFRIKNEYMDQWVEKEKWDD